MAYLEHGAPGTVKPLPAAGNNFEALQNQGNQLLAGAILIETFLNTAKFEEDSAFLDASVFANALRQAGLLGSRDTIGHAAQSAYDTTLGVALTESEYAGTAPSTSRVRWNALAETDVRTESASDRALALLGSVVLLKEISLSLSQETFPDMRYIRSAFTQAAGDNTVFERIVSTLYATSGEYSELIPLLQRKDSSRLADSGTNNAASQALAA
jgi:hypothetical protein